MVENSLLLNSPSHSCRRRGATAYPKVMIWWKSGQNLIKSKQNPLKSGQNLWEPSKTLWKSEQEWHPTCFDLNIMAPELTWKAFSWRSHGVRIETFFIWSNFRASLGESGQNTFAPPKICLLVNLCPIPKLSLHNGAAFCLRQKLRRDLSENLTF